MLLYNFNLYIKKESGELSFNSNKHGSSIGRKHKVFETDNSFKSSASSQCQCVYIKYKIRYVHKIKVKFLLLYLNKP